MATRPSVKTAPAVLAGLGRLPPHKVAICGFPHSNTTLSQLKVMVWSGLATSGKVGNQSNTL